MHAILGHIRIEEDARQHERHDPDAVPASQARKDPMKFARVLQPAEGRRFHSTEENADVSCLRARDDLAEIAFDLGYRHPGEAVIGSQREDQHPRVFDQRRLEPLQSVARGIAPLPGVHDDGLQATPVELRLQMGWEALWLGRGDGKTIPQYHHTGH